MENILVYCTVPNDFSANLIANSLVDEQLAACVNIIDGVTSVYRWEGQVQADKELLLVIKTAKSKFEQLKSRILALHEYSIPEIIAVPVEMGHEEYLKWIADSTK